jgi:hypothetical protein
MPYTIRVCPHPSTNRPAFDLVNETHAKFDALKRRFCDFRNNLFGSSAFLLDADHSVIDTFVTPKGIIDFCSALSREEAVRYMDVAIWLQFNDANGNYHPIDQWQEFQKLTALSELWEIYSRQSSGD